MNAATGGRPAGRSFEGPAVVIIPAHNEENLIARALEVLLADAEPSEFDVVVACNGCTDDTAERARLAASRLGHRVTVLSTPIASKAAAIRAAEAVAPGFPRVYLDADVECSTATARAMVSAVRSGAALAVPTRVLDTSASTPAARAYYGGWSALPWVQEQLAGRGAYTVSRAARETFGEFPDIGADDRFVTTRVPRNEAVVVPHPILIAPPGRLSDVLRVRRRVYAGNVLAPGPAHDRSRANRVGALALTVVRRPSLAPKLVVFAGTTAVAKALTAWDLHRGTVVWGRDEAQRAVRSAPPAASARPATAEPTGTAGADRAELDVVVVTYRSAAYVGESLRAADGALASIPGARIIVVDNDSRDDVAAAIGGISPRIELVLRDVNDGFAAGCHAGVAASDARRVLFLNPDAVVEAEAIVALVRCADTHPDAGVVGGRALAPDGSLDPRSWWGRPTLWSAVCFATGLSSLFPGSRLVDPESPDRWDGRARAVPVVSGGLMLVDRVAWDAVDGFDRDFFLYGEDADFCLRVAAAGWSPRVCPDAVFRHPVGASSAGSNRLPLVLRGRVTTYRKNLSAPWGRLAGELLVLGTGLRALAAGARPSGGRPSIGAAAWRDTWRRRTEWRGGW
ncbi:glycosyltransferase family 2 protein [Pengzhenrongella frigida]|uniref:Glycosyltransferase n=1 Tax=Pengzhenrongella frigida TaxID=1259133 RepID=A0A4Q5N073_9MICO|nr:glycosyltransferase [Cellulomonas sp. HLT2-17]RYV49391.1 glycosyltransferase [Cellulomonas sp. HLT2-17]